MWTSRMAQARGSACRRPDPVRTSGRLFPGVGNQHGFAGSMPVTQAGTYRACAFAIGQNAFGSSVSQLGCSSLTLGGSPFGSLDSATLSGSAGARVIAATGWAIDPLVGGAPSHVHVYVDQPSKTSLFTDVNANQNREDVAAVYRDLGPAHGFSAAVPVSESGTHRVCAFAIPVTTLSSSVLLGCIQVRVP